MDRSILVAHDGSEAAQRALEYALETFPGSRLVLFHAIDPFEVRPGDETDRGQPLTADWFDEHRDDATALFEDALANVDDAWLVDHESGADGEREGSSVETEIGVGSPGQAIVAAVEDLEVDQVVLGGTGRHDVTEARLGSVAELVVRRVDVPVTVVR
ncbi:universal stress protein [Natrarchaeobaculum aegyptiacum]|uniref:Universal stress protein UspA n=1 Tax=Natrarchaeobaculum aegyptiacum TaxID=745377 RepID=A0A2Z2HUY1_9EURY|nr:universal stress protein [Natrarchaeobaculum aegyptiacum]ARS91001.1 universal stress protein UspA [Natrarchaeobaculum aegyptiacum]